jgi:GR25 family glycosyltransferase involved in LPS biosynthesis
MIKIFVIHYDKLVERKENMMKQLNDRKLEAEFVSNKGKDKLLLEEKQNFTKISDSEISLFLHHIECFKNIIEQNHGFALILEDDAILCDNFNLKLQKYIYDLPKDWDILNIGDGDGNSYVPKHVYNKYKGLINIFRKPPNAHKYTEAYLITNEACKKIIEKFNDNKEPINIAIDHYLRDFINCYNLKAFICEPKLVSQGSINNTFCSSIWHSKLHDWNDLNALNPNYKHVK